MIEKQSREEEMQPIEKNYFSCFVFSTCKENEVSFHWLINYKSIKDKKYYYTSDSLWKISLVESIQSIHNSLWTWHDKCNICCRYCIYHVKFNVCLVTKPLGVFSSETEWLNVFFCLLFKKCVICLSLRLRQITQTSVLIIHDIMLNLLQ